MTTQGWGKVIVFICVIVMTIGQLLFKQVAINFNKSEKFIEWDVAGLLFFALTLYMISTGMWVWALRYMDISKAYPYFAFGFVLIPLFGSLFFGETLSLKYGFGILLVVAGVFIVSSTS